MVPFDWQKGGVRTTHQGLIWQLTSTKNTQLEMFVMAAAEASAKTKANRYHFKPFRYCDQIAFAVLQFWANPAVNIHCPSWRVCRAGRDGRYFQPQMKNATHHITTAVWPTMAVCTVSSCSPKLTPITTTVKVACCRGCSMLDKN